MLDPVSAERAFLATRWGEPSKPSAGRTWIDPVTGARVDAAAEYSRLFSQFVASVESLLTGTYYGYSSDDESWANQVLSAVGDWRRQILAAGRSYQDFEDAESRAIESLARNILNDRAQFAADIKSAEYYINDVRSLEAARSQAAAKSAADAQAAEAVRASQAAADASRLEAERRAASLAAIEADIRGAAWNQSAQDLKNYLGAFLNDAFYFPEGIAGARVFVRGSLTLQDLEAARAKALSGAPAVPAYFGSIAGIYKAATGKDLPMNLASYSSAPTQVRFAVEPPGGSALAPAAAAPVPMPVPVGASVAAPVVVAAKAPAQSPARGDYYSAYTEALKRLRAGGSSPFQASAVPVGSVDYSAGIPAVPEDSPAPAAMPQAPASPAMPGWLLPAAAFAAVALLLTRGGPRYV